MAHSVLNMNVQIGYFAIYLVEHNVLLRFTDVSETGLGIDVQAEV